MIGRVLNEKRKAYCLSKVHQFLAVFTLKSINKSTTTKVKPMKRFKDTETWASIFRAMENSSTGYKLDDQHVIIKYGYNFKVKKLNNANGLETILTFELSNTAFCCGVMQFGNFGERADAKDISDETLLMIWKILISFSRTSCHKGIVNAWFYKPRGQTKYQHPITEKMFKLGGAKRIGKQSYNPNSYNQIKGYQFTIL